MDRTRAILPADNHSHCTQYVNIYLFLIHLAYGRSRIIPGGVEDLTTLGHVTLSVAWYPNLHRSVLFTTIILLYPFFPLLIVHAITTTLLRPSFLVLH